MNSLTLTILFFQTWPKKLRSVSSIVVHCIVFYYNITDHYMPLVRGWQSLKGVETKWKLVVHKLQLLHALVPLFIIMYKILPLEAVEEILICTMKWKLMTSYFPNSADSQMRMYKVTVSIWTCGWNTKCCSWNESYCAVLFSMLYRVILILRIKSLSVITH